MTVPVAAITAELLGVLALRLGAWDALLAGLLAGAGFAVGAAAATAFGGLADLAMGTAGVLVGVFLLELVARGLLALPPATDAPRHGAILMPRNSFDACSLLVSGVRIAESEERLARTGEVAVLHVGDSMVFGQSVEPAQAFPALLDARADGMAHLNAGVIGVSIDYELLYLRQWLERIPVRFVVLYLFSGNDLMEIDQNMPCCSSGPLLRYEDGRVLPRCPELQAEQGILTRVRHAPLPYALRAATRSSSLARYLTALFNSRGSSSTTSGDKAARFREILQAVRDELDGRQIPLRVVVLPLRQALSSPNPHETDAYRDHRLMLEQCASLGIPAYDAWALFERLGREATTDRLFANQMENDVHLSPEGHRRLAEWLLGEIPELGAG